MVLIQYVMKAECLRSFSTRTTDTGRLNLYIFAAKIQIPIPNNLLVCEYKGLVSCRNNDLMMENMDKEFTLLKCVLIIWPKILQTPQNLSAQAQKFWISMKEGFIGGFHLHLLVFPFVYQLNYRIGVLVHSSFAND